MKIKSFGKCRILMTSRIVGYIDPPFPKAWELELIAFDQPQIDASPVSGSSKWIPSLSLSSRCLIATSRFADWHASP